MSPLFGVVVALAAAYAVLLLVALAFGDRLMFPAPPPSYGPDEPDLVWIPTPDGGRLPAIWLPDPGAGLTILYSHGNGEDLGTIRFALEELNRLGFAVLAYDYRGYGLGSGRPGAASATEDVALAYGFLTEELGVAPDRVIAYGRSIGGGPATTLAEREPVAGLILESTFTTAFRVVTRFSLLPFDRFRNVEALRRVDAPVLVVHGTEDEVVPFRHGLALYAVAAGPKLSLWVDGAGHNDLLLVAPERYRAAILEFRELVLRSTGA